MLPAVASDKYVPCGAGEGGSDFRQEFSQEPYAGGLLRMGWWDSMGLIPSVGRSGRRDVQITWPKIGVKGRVGTGNAGAMDMFARQILVIFELSTVLLDDDGRFLITFRRSCSSADMVFVWWCQSKAGFRPDSCLLLARVSGACVCEVSTAA